VDKLVAGWVGARDLDVAQAALQEAEVPTAPVMSVRDLLGDPHVQARDNILRIAVDALGSLAMPGVVPKLAATPGRVQSPGPLVPGAHNEEIYCGRLGLSRPELDALRGRGVI
jgi:crotonobetainyl-CoA:carnitine CoA-transferase CaiB-like acyl-CoA transferase